MKRKIILAMLMAMSLAALTGCSVKQKNSETEASTSGYQMETVETPTEGDYFDDTSTTGLHDDTTTSTDATETYETDLVYDEEIDSSVSNTVQSQMTLAIGSTINTSVMDANGNSYTASITPMSLHSAADTISEINEYNAASAEDNIVIDTNTYDYRILEYTISNTVGISTPIEAELPCKVVGNNTDTSDTLLHYNGGNYEGGTVYYLSDDKVQDNKLSTMKVLFCVPKGCTDYALQLGYTPMTLNCNGL